MKYQIPRGMQDILPAQSGKWQELESLLRNFSDIYGYEEIRTPIVEHTNVFKRENDSSDMVNKEMYTFTLPNSSTSLTLRPEGTAGVVRSYVENKLFALPDQPVKLYYMGEMARHERPQKGRQRIFHQFGVESLGAKSPYADAEAMVLAYSILKTLGLDDVKILINTLGDEESRQEYRSVLREYFKPHLNDMCADCQRRYEQNPLRILDCKVDADKEWMKNAPMMKDSLNAASADYFKTVLEILDAMGIPYEVSDSLVRGLDYYTHTVFEIVSENKEMGAQSTVLAGGRYDGLIPYFGGPELSGIGWALGMERLLLALEAEGIVLGSEPALDVYVLCADAPGKIPAFSLTTALRSNGYHADMDLAGKSFKAQMKAANRKKARYTAILGSSELEKNTITMKNMETGEQQEIEQEMLIPWLDARMEHEEDCTCEICQGKEE